MEVLDRGTVICKLQCVHPLRRDLHVYPTARNVRSGRIASLNLSRWILSEPYALYFSPSRPGHLNVLNSQVMRQFKFTNQVYRLGWTSPAFQGSHLEVITNSIREYHMFLDVSKQTLRSLVPTTSIDLSWHTHMLYGERYHQDVLRYVDRFLDHDDRVEEGILGELNNERPRTILISIS